MAPTRYASGLTALAEALHNEAAGDEEADEDDEYDDEEEEEGKGASKTPFSRASTAVFVDGSLAKATKAAAVAGRPLLVVVSSQTSAEDLSACDLSRALLDETVWYGMVWYGSPMVAPWRYLRNKVF